MPLDIPTPGAAQGAICPHKPALTCMTVILTGKLKMKAISGKRGLRCNGAKSSTLPNFLTVLNQWSSSIPPGDNNNAIAKRCRGSIISQSLALGKLMKAGPGGAVPVIVLFSFAVI